MEGALEFSTLKSKSRNKDQVSQLFFVSSLVRKILPLASTFMADDATSGFDGVLLEYN